MSLTVRDTRFKDAKLIVLQPYIDGRGFFKETFVKSKYRDIGIVEEFVQDSSSFSVKNVLRGLHCDPMMSKLVQCVRGAVFDVIVDARPHSETFAQWQGFDLSEHNHAQLYVPAGFLHGFIALSDDVVFAYKQGAEYSPAREIGVRWDDPDLAIAWPIVGEPIVSPKDCANAMFRSVFGAVKR